MNLKRILLAALFLLPLGAAVRNAPANAAAVFPYASATSTPAPNVGSLPRHIAQYEALSPCFHIDSRASNNATGCPFASPVPTAGPNGANADYRDLSAFVDYIEPQGRQSMSIAGNAGIKVVTYQDLAILHGYYQTSRQGMQNQNNQSASSNCVSTLPNWLSLTDSYAGYLFYFPNKNQTLQTACAGNYYGSIIGDPSDATIDTFRSQIEATALYVSNYQYGINAKTPYSTNAQLVRWDDEDYPGHIFFDLGQSGYQTNGGNTVCRGSAAVSIGSSANTSTSCATLGMGIATSSEHPYLRMQSYPNFMNAQWVAQTQKQFRMPADLGMGSIFNDDTDPTYGIYYRGPNNNNVKAAQCETCITYNTNASTAGQYWSEIPWQDHINAEIDANAFGVAFMAFRGVVGSAVDQAYLYGSLWLGMGRPDLVQVNEQNGGSTPGGPITTTLSVNSQINISPLSYVIPTQPINDPATLKFDPFAVGYNPNYSHFGFGVGTLKQPGGMYLREFKQCYRGDVLTGAGFDTAIGPCAAVVEMNYTTATFPTTLQTYAHTAVPVNYGIITATEFGGGDTGTLNVAGTAPPAAGSTQTTTLQGQAWILTQ